MTPTNRSCIDATHGGNAHYSSERNIITSREAKLASGLVDTVPEVLKETSTGAVAETNRGLTCKKSLRDR